MKFALLRLAILFIFYVLKVNGLIPFQFSRIDRKAYIDFSTTLYSFCLTILFTVFIITSCIVFLINPLYSEDNPSNVTKFVTNFEVVFLTISASLTFILHFIRRKKLMILANDIFCIRNYMMQIFPDDETFARSFSEEFGYRLLNSCFQLLGLLSMIAFCAIALANILTFKEILLICISFYIHSMTTISLSLYFYGGIITSLTLYQKINGTIKKLMNVIGSQEYPSAGLNMQMSCNISDILDRLSVLYARINLFTQGICDFFQLQIIFLLFTGFCQLIASVSALRVSLDLLKEYGKL